MDLKDYINKNLPNLNWNILPQIFEENNVELTDEIVEYLKTTPWNTNWSILNELGGNSSTTSLILDTTAKFTSMNSWAMLQYNYNILEGLDSITAETITVTLDGTTVELPKIIGDESSFISYGEDGEMAPSFSNYPVYVSFTITKKYQKIITIYIQSTGTHSIKIVVNQPGIPPVIKN